MSKSGGDASEVDAESLKRNDADHVRALPRGEVAEIEVTTQLEVAPPSTSSAVHHHASIDARDVSHHYAAVMNYAAVMKKRCFA